MRSSQQAALHCMRRHKADVIRAAAGSRAPAARPSAARLDELHRWPSLLAAGHTGGQPGCFALLAIALVSAGLLSTSLWVSQRQRRTRDKVVCNSTAIEAVSKHAAVLTKPWLHAAATVTSCAVKSARQQGSAQGCRQSCLVPSSRQQTACGKRGTYAARARRGDTEAVNQYMHVRVPLHRRARGLQKRATLLLLLLACFQSTAHAFQLPQPAVDLMSNITHAVREQLASQLPAEPAGNASDDADGSLAHSMQGGAKRVAKKGLEAVGLPLKRPRLAVRLYWWLRSNWQSAVIARFAALVLVVRLAAVPWATWRQVAGHVNAGVQRMLLGSVLVLLVGPTCGAVLVWALILLPVVLAVVFVVAMYVRLAAR